MIKNVVLRSIVEGTNIAATVISTGLEEMLTTVIETAELSQETTLEELIYATYEIMFNLFENDDIEEEEYLELCRECTYLLVDGDISSLTA